MTPQHSKAAVDPRLYMCKLLLKAGISWSPMIKKAVIEIRPHYLLTLIKLSTYNEKQQNDDFPRMEHLPKYDKQAAGSR